MRVLLAEDDAQLAETMARGLRRQGMAVDVAGEHVRELVRHHRRHLVLAAARRSRPETGGICYPAPSGAASPAQPVRRSPRNPVERGLSVDGPLP